MFKIYGLVCPRLGMIRYIGKTKNTLEGRLKGHLSDARMFKYKHHTSRWIRKLLRDDLSPDIVLLEEVSGDWVKAEIWWIAQGRKLGWPLTNSTIGGDGAPAPTPEALARKSKTMEKVWERPEFIQRMKDARNDPVFLAEQSERLKKRWEVKAHREKMLASRWTPEARAEQAAQLESRREKMKASMTPEVRARQAATLKATWAKRKAAKAR